MYSRYSRIIKAAKKPVESPAGKGYIVIIPAIISKQYKIEWLQTKPAMDLPDIIILIIRILLNTQQNIRPMHYFPQVSFNQRPSKTSQGPHKGALFKGICMINIDGRNKTEFFFTEP